MSLRRRIFAVIGLMVTFAMVQAVAVAYLEDLRNMSDSDIARASQRLDYQSRIYRAVVELDNDQRSFVLTGQSAVRGAFDRRWNDYTSIVTLLAPYVDDQEDKKTIANVEGLIQQWHLAVIGVMNARATTTDSATALESQADPLMLRIKDELTRTQQHDLALLNAKIREATDRSFRNALITLTLPAVDIMMLLLLVVVLARSLLDPLGAIAKSARQISGGDFDVKLPPERPNEIGDLVNAFSDMSAAVQRRQRELSDALSREREISQMYASLRANAEQESARLQATIATVPAALVILEKPGGRVVLSNATADKLIGREPDDPIERKAYWDSFRVSYRDGRECPTEDWGPRRALRGETVIGQELIVATQDGRSIPILVSAAPLRNDLGVITGAVAAFQDITSLYEVDRLKNEFVSIVSHELRTPLTSIKGSLQLLLTDVPMMDPDHRVLMDVALSNTDRLVRIINDILDISKIEAGKLELNRRPYDVNELVSHSIQSVGQIAKGSSVTLTPRIPADVPRVMADPDRTVQAIVNLLSNALKYAPARSEVTLTVTPEPAGLVTFAIADRGRGIPADKLGQLFQKFQQIDGADSRRFRGTGLGLAITKALVEMQGRSVAVTSECGKGSTFSISLPVAKQL